MKKIKEMYKKIEEYPRGWPEMVVVLLYLCLRSVVSFFHEPWFDESVAWLIARDSSIWDILFEIPHYEGHPPLWHLILVPFAKTGMPYELSLSVVSLLFTGTAIFLIEKYAPFPRIVKWILPFTYFFFYQYSVISRPYSVMMLAIVLLAMAHKKRNEKPVYYIGALVLLCLTSACGILMAGGIAFAWLIEIKEKKSILDCIKATKQDARLRWLIVLLGFAVILCIVLIPAKDAYAVRSHFDIGNLKYLVYTFFVMIMDSICSSAWANYNLLQLSDLQFSSLFASVVLGIVILGGIVYYVCNRRTLGYFLFPYIAYSVFSAVVYCSPHHIGIINYILLFTFWISMEIKEKSENDIKDIFEWKKIWNNVSGHLKQSIEAMPVVIGIFMCCISIIWSVNSSFLDIKYPYNGARKISKFIKENHLENYQIMAEWVQEKDENDNIIGDYVNLIQNYTILPYFDTSIFMNGECGTDGNYVLHKNLSQKDTEKWYTKIRQRELPDVFIGNVFIWDMPLERVYGMDAINEKYIMVYCEKVGKIWKDQWFCKYDTIFVRKELAEELGLQVVN